MTEEPPPPDRQPSFIWKGGDRSGGRADVAGGSPAERQSLLHIATVISGRNNLRPISFLERGVQLAAAVAHIAVLGERSGTGVLIAPDVLLTNNHVLASESKARKAIIRFNYQDGLDGKALTPVIVKCVPEHGFFTSPYLDDVVDEDHLDFTVVRLAEPVGERFGTVVLDGTITVEPPMDVVIIQHPGGQKKQIAITDNELVHEDDFTCQYFTDTLRGSSGAPVFNDDWRLVALHHAGDDRPQPGAGRRSVQNEGIRVSAITPRLPEWAR